MSLLALFCSVDDFCQQYVMTDLELQMGRGTRRRRRKGELEMSEIMTIIIHFHQSHYRNFKAYYTHYVGVHLCREFPKLVSYTP
jgi:hypothetical protein